MSLVGLRAEVKVEPGLEPVEGQLAWGKEALGGGGGGGLEEPGVGGEGPAGLGPWGGCWAGAGSWGLTGSGQMTGQESCVVVALVEGVDEGVESLAAGAVGDEGSVEDAGHLGGELGSVLVEGKVAVGGVVGVDEGVEVGVDGLVVVLLVVWDQGLGLDLLGLGPGSGTDLLDGLLWGTGSGLLWLGLGNESGSILT